MIPWRLRFTGIRDYPAIDLDFSDKSDHILISGPNGAGKSTITFCMGAVLYSGKVVIDGLKSNNLPTDQTWHAKIDLLFKNDGAKKVDAPQYVQFRLDIEQKPSDPIKREFYIEEGDVIDEWERSTKFTSGGKYNFTEYKQQIIHKYAVDPDAYYLIWYQKEVNQFAEMHPEERFRIFSEMNGIDKIQKNWEESKALVKETELTLEEAESKQGLNKLQLQQKKGELDRYLDRNRRLKRGYIEYRVALKWLKTYYLDQINSLKGQIEQLEETRIETNDHKRSLECKWHEKSDQDQLLEQKINELNKQNESLDHKRKALINQLKDRQAKRDTISSEIDHITKEVDRIGQSRKDVEQQLTNAKTTVDQLSKTIDDLERKIKVINAKVNEDLNQTIATLNEQIKQDELKYHQVKDLIDTYKSSALVQEEIEMNDNNIDRYRNDLIDLRRKQIELTKELEALKKNQLISSRQEQSINYFKNQNIIVYPMRELLELDSSAKASDEQLFDTIKYTLFVNKKIFNAPNDLYHVSLPNIIPDKSLTHLPEQRIKVKAGLTDDLYAFAVKALCWTRTFFEEEKPNIDQGKLIDQRGVRGPQEEKRLILNEKMVQVYREDVEKELNQTNGRINLFEEKVKQLNQQNMTLFNRRESLKDAEAFLTKENERELRKERQRKLVAERKDLLDQKDDLEAELDQARTDRAKWQQELNTYQMYYETYLLYEQEQDKIEEVQSLDEEIKQLQSNRQKLTKQLTEIDEALEDETQKRRRLNRSIEDIDDRIQSQAREIDQIERQIQDRTEERFTNEEVFSKTKQDLDRLESSASYELEDEEPKLTRSQAEEMRERGKATYELALSITDIDEAAPENYQKMKEEYDTSANEVKKSKILLDQYRERMEHFKEDLENTISMRILGVNQKFVHYMSLFSFEGNIEWDYLVDRHGQTRYRLYIKARKQGHRGKLEDVSEKARGGKVGRGVSGGEESLSSLLFALALLQTIESSPGYIVLDEFDSALDESRKDKVFELYEQELKRKMIILTPKSHEEEYLHRFSKAYVVYHDPSVPKSKIFKVKRQVT